jgi:hypothetical protein
MRIIFTFLLAILLLSCDKSVLENSNSSGIQNGTGGSLARFTLAGNYLYVIEDASLKTFDVTNPANPILKNTLGIGNNIETI